jgi:hypothetical protein
MSKSMWNPARTEQMHLHNCNSTEQMVFEVLRENPGITSTRIANLGRALLQGREGGKLFEMALWRLRKAGRVVREKGHGPRGGFGYFALANDPQVV